MLDRRGWSRVGNRRKSQSSETRSRSVTTCSDLTIWTECLNARQIVTRWALRTFEARGQVVLHFCFRKGAHSLAPGTLAGRSNPVGCWHFAVALVGLQSTPPPCWPGGGGLALGKCKSQSSETRSRFVTTCSDLTIWTECQNARQMVTRWALRTFEARGQVVLHFC